MDKEIIYLVQELNRTPNVNRKMRRKQEKLIRMLLNRIPGDKTLAYKNGRVHIVPRDER